MNMDNEFEVPNEMSEAETDALYAVIMSITYASDGTVDDFLTIHEQMQKDANKLVDAHPMNKNVIALLKRNPDNAEMKKEILSRVHMPGAKPLECKYCAQIVEFYNRAMSFEKDFIGVDRNVDEKRGDSFRHTIQIAQGVYKRMKESERNE
jgi:hypothetical protein